jgi:hypothetical protein
MRQRKRGGITCQIFIEQRDGGTVWIPWKTVIEYALHNRVNIESQRDVRSSGEEFATLGSAMEATQQRALHIIQEKHPNVRKDEVNWCLISEDVGEFVTV